MTPQRAKELLPVIQAFAEGKTIQYRTAHSPWYDSTNLGFSEDYCEYRIKPSKVWRPWKPEEVPFDAVFTHQAWPRGSFIRILEVINNKFFTTYLGKIEEHKFDYLDQSMKYSIDGGKTWLPCGVEEDSNS